MDHPSDISILVLGNLRRREFRHARAYLDGSGRVTEVPSADEAGALLCHEAITPAVIVITQSYPGEFPAESIDRLRRQAPLARIVGLLGSWCEGETRSGYPWPAALRLYWHQWVPQASCEMENLLRGDGSTWSLPGTATDEERLLACPRRPSDRREGLLALCAQRFEIHDWLAAAARGRGFSTVWLRPGRPVRVQGVRAAIFDATAAYESEMARLRQFRDTLGRAVPILVLLDFPRIEDHDRARASGAAATLSKPLLVDDLFWQLDRLIGEKG